MEDDNCTNGNKTTKKKRLIINGSEEEVRHLGFVSASVCERLPSSDGTPNCVGTNSFSKKTKMYRLSVN